MNSIVSISNHPLQIQVLTILENNIEKLVMDLEDIIEKKADLINQIIILKLSGDLKLSIPDMAVLLDTLQEMEIFVAGIISSDKKLREFAHYSGLKSMNYLPSLNTQEENNNDFNAGLDSTKIEPTNQASPPKTPTPSDDAKNIFDNNGVEDSSQSAVGNNADIDGSSQGAVDNNSQSPNVHEPTEESHSKTKDSEKATPQTIIVRQPVKTGQRIRNEKGDLVILGPVEKGAIVAAAGDVMIHSICEGVVLAGINGNADSSIYTNQLLAEAIAIGSYFAKKDQYSNVRKDLPLKISLNGSQLNFTGLNKQLTPPLEKETSKVSTPEPITDQQSNQNPHWSNQQAPVAQPHSTNSSWQEPRISPITENQTL